MALEILQDIPVDQMIALSCQVISLVSAIAFYHLLHIKNTSPTTRHLVSATIGVGIIVALYGLESVHMFVLVVVSYVMMMYLPLFYRGWMVFGACITYVLAVHLHSYIYHYLQFRVEVSGSLMVLAIKISYTAFSLDDYNQAEGKLTKNQRKYRLQKLPSFLEHFCFSFCFLGVLFGPAYHFKDYLTFINGLQYKSYWPAGKAWRKLSISLVCLLCHYLLADSYGPTYNLSADVMRSSIFTRHAILWFTMFAARCKYYFSWISSEAICLFCGLGYDPSEAGEKEWGTAISAVNILNIEMATNLKMFSDNWNTFTARWLHFCLYERVKKYKVLLVFLLSASWHGFYPGYMAMFMPLAFAILLSRQLRHAVRPLFQQTPASRFFYDVCTWLATAVLISFNSFAFELKAWPPIYSLQRSLYFWPHMAVVFGLLIMAMTGKRPQTAKGSAAEKNGNHWRSNGSNGVHSLHAG